MQQELLNMKKKIMELHDTILGLSAGLWEMNTQIDDILLDDMGIKPAHDMSTDDPYGEDDGGACEVTHSEPQPPARGEHHGDYTPQEEQKVRVRGRPKREPLPEPPELPRRAEPQKEARKQAIEPEVMPRTTETPKKQGIVDRLLGKDAGDKARLRAEKVAQLEQELAEMRKK